MSKQKEIKTNAMRILEKNKMNYIQHQYECEEFIDGTQTADHLGLPYEKVFKTLVTIGHSREYFVFVIPINRELHLKKAAAAVGEKAVEMIMLKDLTAITGYVRGGCTAIGMKKQFKTVIDKSAESQEQIYVSGGKIGVQIELKPADFCKAAGAVFGEITV